MLLSTTTPLHRRDDLSQQHEFHDAVRKAITTHGWAVISDTTPLGPVAYTVGRAAHGEPEFLVYGLRPVVAENVLNALTTQANTHGTPNSHEPVRGILSGTELAVIPIDDTRTHLPAANDFYALSESVTGLQIVFPDRLGRWPWESDSHLADMPLLSTSRAN